MRSTLPTTTPVRYSRGFAWAVNRSSRLGRDLQATLAGLAAHLGGEVSMTQLFLAERLTFLERRLRDHESQVLNGQAPIMTEGEYTAATGQLSGLCGRLGLHRKARDVASLRSYLASKTQGSG